MQDTVTGFLLAGIGNVDLRKKSNFLVVTESKHTGLALLSERQVLVEWCMGALVVAHCYLKTEAWL